MNVPGTGSVPVRGGENTRPRSASAMVGDVAPVSVGKMAAAVSAMLVPMRAVRVPMREMSVPMHGVPAAMRMGAVRVTVMPVGA